MISVTLDAEELFLEVHHFLFFTFRMWDDVPRKLALKWVISPKKDIILQLDASFTVWPFFNFFCFFSVSAISELLWCPGGPSGTFFDVQSHQCCPEAVELRRVCRHCLWCLTGKREVCLWGFIMVKQSFVYILLLKDFVIKNVLCVSLRS